MNNKTDKVLRSSGFFSAKPNTVWDIFRLENLNIDSEMDLVFALEAYIKHHTTSDPQILSKVRPAIQSIRFMTLEAEDLAKASFLSAEEVRQILLRQVPLNFSQSKIKRGKQGENKQETVRPLRGIINFNDEPQFIFNVNPPRAITGPNGTFNRLL